MWVPTNCPCNLCRLYVHNVGTNKLCNLCRPYVHNVYQQIAHATYVWVAQTTYVGPTQCGYQQIAHATYVGPMCTMWVPTNCPCNLCRPYVHNVGTNKLPMQPM